MCGTLSLCPASCPPFFPLTLSSLYASPSLLSWQADCNPNLLLTSPLQLSQGPSKLNITHGDGSLLGSPEPGRGLVSERRRVETDAGLEALEDPETVGRARGHTRDPSASVLLFELLKCLFAEPLPLRSADPAGWWAVVPWAK